MWRSAQCAQSQFAAATTLVERGLLPIPIGGVDQQTAESEISAICPVKGILEGFKVSLTVETDLKQYPLAASLHLTPPKKEKVERFLGQQRAGTGELVCPREGGMALMISFVVIIKGFISIRSPNLR